MNIELSAPVDPFQLAKIAGSPPNISISPVQETIRTINLRYFILEEKTISQKHKSENMSMAYTYLIYLSRSLERISVPAKLQCVDFCLSSKVECGETLYAYFNLDVPSKYLSKPTDELFTPNVGTQMLRQRGRNW